MLTVVRIISTCLILTVSSFTVTVHRGLKRVRLFFYDGGLPKINTL